MVTPVGKRGTLSNLDHINTNNHKAAFWMLAYILHDPELYDTPVEEIQPAFDQDPTTPSAQHLLEKCTRLNAASDVCLLCFCPARHRQHSDRRKASPQGERPNDPLSAAAF